MPRYRVKLFKRMELEIDVDARNAHHAEQVAIDQLADTSWEWQDASTEQAESVTLIPKAKRSKRWSAT